MAQKLSEIKKELLRKFVNYKCAICHKKDYKLIPHRLQRGRDGGKYTLNNIIMICEEDHKKIHYKEFK